MKEWMESINQVDLFSGIGTRERESLLESAAEINLKSNQALFEAHSPADHFYLVLRGALKTYYSVTPGQKLLLDFWGPGEALGEDSVLLSQEHDLSAVSVDRTTVLGIPASNLRRVLDHHPRLGLGLAALAAARTRAYRERLCLMSNALVPVRLSAALYRLARAFGKRDRRGTIIMLRLTHQDLADHIGSSRETVTLFLSRFKKDGLIMKNGRKLIIPDLKGLKKFTD